MYVLEEINRQRPPLSNFSTADTNIGTKFGEWIQNGVLAAAQ